jgi:WD40 repeat protein
MAAASAGSGFAGFEVLPPEELNAALEDFEVTELVGRGGMGAVYRARETKLNREVAIKLLAREAGADPEFAERISREAQVTARLDHPSIVPVYAVGYDAQRRFYYSMRLVRGRELGEIFRMANEGREGWNVARSGRDRAGVPGGGVRARQGRGASRPQAGEHHGRRSGRGVHHGLGLAKMAGVADLRDIRLRLAADGVSALDTIVAGGAGTDSPLMTMDGSVVGTPAYMPPEQALSRVEEVDHLSDIYSLGAILYELLAGHPPYSPRGSSSTPAQILGTLTTKPPERLRTENPRAPAELVAVCEKAMARRREDRYRHALDLAQELQAWLDGRVVGAYGTGALITARKWVGRNRALATASLVLTILGLLAVTVVQFFAKRAVSTALVNEQQANTKAPRSAEVATANEKAARRALAKSALSLAEAAQREGNGLAMQAALAGVPDDLRDATWTYLLGESDTSFASLRQNSGAVPLPTIDGIAADPSRPGVFAVAGADYRVALVNVRSGRRLLEFTPGFKSETPKNAGGIRVSLAFSPDGQRVAVGRTGKLGRIVFHSTRDGKKLSEWEAHSTASLEFSPDGKLLLQNTADHANPWWHTEMWDAATGRLLWKYNPETDPRRSFFTSDGEQVLPCGKRGELHLLKASDGTVVRSFPDRVHWQQGVNVFRRLLGASGLIAHAVDDHTIVVSDLKTGSLVTRFQHPKGMWGIRLLAFTPDGEQLVTTMAMPDGREALNVWNARTGFLARSLLGGRSRNLAMAVHPVSGELLVCGDYPRAWDLTGVKPRWLVPSRVMGELTFWGDDDTVIVPGGIEALARGGGGSSPRRKGIVGLYQNPSVSADGHWAAIPSGSGANSVRILHQRDGVTEETRSLNGPSGQWNSSRARLSPEGDQVVVYWTTQPETPLHWYSRLTGEVAGKIERGKITQVHDLGWPSGSRLIGLATTDGLRSDKDSAEHVVLWDMASGKILRMARHPTEMDALALAPDGKRFAEAGADKNVRIRDAETLEVLKEFRAHDGPITALAWHPTQPIVATASADLSLRLWNLDTGRIIEEFRGWVQPIHDLAFSPSGRRLGAAIANEPTRIWEPESLNDPSAKSRQ